jgi:hypothetical protein
VATIPNAIPKAENHEDGFASRGVTEFKEIKTVGVQC